MLGIVVSIRMTPLIESYILVTREWHYLKGVEGLGGVDFLE